MPQAPLVIGRPVIDSQDISPDDSIELGVVANIDSVDLLPAETAETATNRPSASSTALVATSTFCGAAWGALFGAVGYIINAASHNSAPDHTQNWYGASFIFQATGIGIVAGAAAGTACAVASIVVSADPCVRRFRSVSDFFVNRLRTRSNPTDGSGIDEGTPFNSVLPTSSSSAGNRGL
jgi:hypothetical protein